MKHLALLSSLLIFNLTIAQQSHDLIPKDAVTVFSINNFSLLQKVSLDELVQYDFMQDIQQELFDGSTTGSTIKDSGIDFNQKLNVFYGKTHQYEVSGFTFGIVNKEQLFTVFDDFQKEESQYPGVERYSSYFNQLILTKDAGILIRVEPNYRTIEDAADSAWYAQGHENYWWYDDYYDYEDYDPEYEEEDEYIDDSDKTIESIEIEEEIDELEIYEELPPVESEEEFDDELPEAEETGGKSYWELRDSIEYELQLQFLNEVTDGLFIKKENLLKLDKTFADQMTHNSDGIFYLDNARNLQKDQSFWYMRTMFPSLYQDIKELYSGNVMVGDIMLNEHNVELKMVANYSDQLGSIYEKMNGSKFDANILKYIHEDNTAFFTYNVDLREAYEQAFKVIYPILDDEQNAQISMNLLVLELLNEFVDKDALFGAYKGSMFGSFNGIQKVNTKKIEFFYDEETFEYEEREVEAVEDMPIFTLGFSTERGDIAEKILTRLSRLTSRFENMGGYWQFDEAILESVPLYMINKNGLFIFTNDEDLAKKHSNGYGSNAISGKKAKEIKKNGFAYAEFDWGGVIDKLPRDLFNGEQNEILDAMSGKGGKIKLTSTKTTKKNTHFDLVYTFDGQYDNSGKYILDFINSIYVITK